MEMVNKEDRICKVCNNNKQIKNFTPYSEPVTSSKEGSSCDIRHQRHILP